MKLFSRKLGKAIELSTIVKDGTWADHGFRSADEAQFVLTQTEKGVLTPNLTNMLVGTSRAGRQSNKRRKILEVWMGMFSNTERFNRRVTAVAAYRLERERMLEAGISEEALSTPGTEHFEHLTNRSVTAVNSSQGEYALYNRPAWARSGGGKIVYTYKQFVVITVELMRNLAPPERIIFLSMLVFLSGVKGIPFAGDDLLDLVDFLAQMFGIDIEGAEVNVAQFFDAMVPGSSRIMMRGVVDYVLGTTASTRLGHGDLIPGTGAWRETANAGREWTNILGPTASAVEGLLGGVALTARYAGEVLGLREDTTTLADLGRQGFGSSAIRGFTEGLIYHHDGAITNDRGQVVSNKVSTMDVLWRMLGFYPGEATRHNDVVRMAKHADGYAKEIKTAFIDSIRRATAAGNMTDVARIKADVRQWNQTHGPASVFYIRDFGMKAARAVREGKRTTSARYLKSAPRNVRPLLKDLMRLYDFDSRGISITDIE